jgi:pimeloyl-ACP methyl ester carboxylesterase
MRRLAFLQMVLSEDYLARCDRDQVALELAPLFGHDLAQTPPVVLKQLNALRRFNATARLGELASIPTQVVSAERDIIFPPRCGRALAEAIPGAQFFEIPHAAHG